MPLYMNVILTTKQKLCMPPLKMMCWIENSYWEHKKIILRNAQDLVKINHRKLHEAFNWAQALSPLRGDCLGNMLDPPVETITLCGGRHQVGCERHKPNDLSSCRSHIWRIDPIDYWSQVIVSIFPHYKGYRLTCTRHNMHLYSSSPMP